MGTRNLTMVIANAETKVAQYGQWDGYPEGQGATALEFLRGANLSEFKDKVSKLRWLTTDEVEIINKDSDWPSKYPYLSRDAGAEILYAVHYGEMSIRRNKTQVEILGLVDQSDFAADSLMCEWAYVIDLDKNTFEVYSGFNKTPLTPEDRFFSLALPERAGEYKQIKIVKSYSLTELPTEGQFLADLTPVESE